jgi:hypothetical protein
VRVFPSDQAVLSSIRFSRARHSGRRSDAGADSFGFFTGSICEAGPNATSAACSGVLWLHSLQPKRGSRPHGRDRHDGWTHLKPRLIFDRCIDFLIQRRVQVPKSGTLLELVRSGLQARKAELVALMDAHLTDEARGLLDDLFTAPEESEPLSADAAQEAVAIDQADMH